MRGHRLHHGANAAIWAAIILLSSRSGVAPAAQYHWWEGAPNGYWDESNSWNPPVVPGTNDVGFVYSRYGGVLTPQYRSTSSPVLLSIQADTPTGTGSVSFTQAQDRLKAQTVTVGIYGPAAWTQSGGLAEFSLLRLGEWAGGVGTFRLQGTGQLTSSSTEIGTGAGVGYFYLSSGAVHHPGTLWIADGSLYNVEGGSTDPDTLTVDANYLQTGGNAAVAGELKVQLGNPPAGKVDLRGGSLHAGTLNLPYGTFEQSGGTFTAVTTTNGGASLCSITLGTFSAGPITNNGFFGQSGGNATLKSLFTNHAGATFQHSGGIASCPKLVNHAANMTIMGTADCRIRILENNNAIHLQNGLLRGTEAMPGLFWICQFANAGTFTMSGGEFRGELTNTGTFSYSAGTFTSGHLINQGVFSRSVPFSCLRLVNSASLTADATRPITAAGTGYPSAIENTADGVLTVGGTGLMVTGTKPLANSGTLRGSGTIVANVENGGIIRVGTAAVVNATLNIQGDYTQPAAGEIQLDVTERIGGGAATDRLAITGHASLGGTLRVSGSSYSPNAGDQLSVLTFGSCSGDFATWILPALPPGLVWIRQQTPTALALVAGHAIPQDFDEDGDVDKTDLDAFRVCGSRAAVPYASGCSGKDFDDDGDVDMDDFGVFQRCFSGPGRPADLHCAD